MVDHAHNKRAQRRRGRPFGTITRGTTGVNRLRKSDRWSVQQPLVRQALGAGIWPARPTHTDVPLAIDVGYGASHTTTVEWARWLRRLRPDVEVVGLEIDPARVLPACDGVRFELGGFELAGYHPHLVRAFNVLRQYDVAEVEEVWSALGERLAPGGVIIEGTCDEVGRVGAWVLLTAVGPQSLTLCWDPWHVARPSVVAERLPKALIHRNVPGEPIHQLLAAVDAAWDGAAGWDPYGPRIRWEKTRAALAADGLPLHPEPRRTREARLTVDWDVVTPR